MFLFVMMFVCILGEIRFIFDNWDVGVLVLGLIIVVLRLNWLMFVLLIDCFNVVKVCWYSCNVEMRILLVIVVDMGDINVWVKLDCFKFFGLVLGIWMSELFE